jgi:aminodeoxyfutalosine deaminase
MSERSSLRHFVEQLPKAELHVHLEGSMRPELLLELARKRGVSLPADDISGLRRWFQFRDYAHFLEIYLTCSSCLREPEDFQALVADFAAQQSAQNIVYSEVHFTISTHVGHGVSGVDIAQALGESLINAEEKNGVRIRLIPDIVRNISPKAADVTIDWALTHREVGVVALGIAGMEGASVAPFSEHFVAARDAGLHTTAHAGEQCGPESIHEVLDVCQPERIGHGISAIEDPTLLRRLAAERIPLEVCPTSNVRLGYADSVARHPFDRLRRAGVAVSVNSDDPTLFETSLIDEYHALETAFGYSRSQLGELARAGFEHSFLDDGLRAAYLEQFDAQLTTLLRATA